MTTASFFSVGSRKVGNDASVFVIAEAGLNHNGSMDRATEMIGVAAKCGVDAIKFQTFNTETLFAKDDPYLSVFQNADISSLDDLRKLKQVAMDAGIIFMSGVGDFASLETLLTIDTPCLKMSSANITNLPLMARAAGSGVPVVISTGASTLSEIVEAADRLRVEGVSGLGILACTSLYPCKPEFANLSRIRKLHSIFPDAVIGYSDHTLGTTACVAAVTMGAKIVEKHFTLDRNLEGPDHTFSADPAELAQLVQEIRAVERMFGDGTFTVSEEEAVMRPIIRRGLAAARPIARGETIDEDMVLFRRGASAGLDPKFLDFVIGREARRKIEEGAAIVLQDLV